MTKSPGIHHITAIASTAADNADFYQNVLGLRMIKKTINYDDPSVYHLYYGDDVGSPGTALTFFPRPNAKAGVRGGAEASETGLSVPVGSLPFWQLRFQDMDIAYDKIEHRFGESYLGFKDSDGMSFALVEQVFADSIPAKGRAGIAGAHAIRGFSGITLHSVKPKSTANIMRLLGFTQIASEGLLTRWSSGETGLGTNIDIKDCSGSELHRQGAGSVHHVAFSAVDDASQAEMAKKVRELGITVTEQRDRNYFRSVYFREPGGTLIEIATLDPGFAVDEPIEQLGERLMLPSWLEPRRAEIEAALPRLVA